MRDRKGSREARPGQRWSRRESLTRTTAAGLTVSLPGWLIGCGDDDCGPRGATPTPTAVPTPTAGPRPLEDCTLQFDLSDTGLEQLEIHVFGSEDDGGRLQEHTAESRAHFRDENPALADVADEDLTHFIEDVTLPSDALQLYWVTGCLQDGEDALGGLNVHVPQQALIALAETAAARGLGQVRTSKMRYYGIGTGQQNVNDLYPDVASFVSPFDTALALLFQQPDLMNINVTQGASILELLQKMPCTGQNPCEDRFIDSLAFDIACAWRATASGRIKVDDPRREIAAWARIVPVIGVNGQPVMDSRGNPAMTYDVSDAIGRTVLSVAQQMRKFILNSAEF